MISFLFIIIKDEKSLNVAQMCAYFHHILCTSINLREAQSGLLRAHSRISLFLLLKLWGEHVLWSPFLESLRVESLEEGLSLQEVLPLSWSSVSGGWTGDREGRKREGLLILSIRLSAWEACIQLTEIPIFSSQTMKWLTRSAHLSFPSWF